MIMIRAVLSKRNVFSLNDCGHFCSWDNVLSLMCERPWCWPSPSPWNCCQCRQVPPDYRCDICATVKEP